MSPVNTSARGLHSRRSKKGRAYLRTPPRPATLRLVARSVRSTPRSRSFPVTSSSGPPRCSTRSCPSRVLPPRQPGSRHVPTACASGRRSSTRCRSASSSGIRAEFLAGPKSRTTPSAMASIGARHVLTTRSCRLDFRLALGSPSTRRVRPRHLLPRSSLFLRSCSLLFLLFSLFGGSFGVSS